MDELKQNSVTHGGLYGRRHPQLGADIVGESAVRYLRFRRPVTVERLELGPIIYGRWVPAVPVHPAHLIVSTLDPATRRWRMVKDVNLPPDPRIAGKGLSQKMTVEQMDARFADVMKGPPRRIDLGGLKTDHLRVECDREHPHWPNHGETGGGVHCVQFGALNNLKAFGRAGKGKEQEPVYNPILKQGRIRPRAPRGMEIVDHPLMLLYRGKKLSVGFSLRRPLLMHLGWDARGKGEADVNRLKVSRQPEMTYYTLAGFNGPVLRTLSLDAGPCHWTGTVEVQGNRVCYRGLAALDGMQVDAVFTVEPDRLVLELAQACPRAMPVLEADAWRFGWDLRTSMTACPTVPTLAPGRNGDVLLPAMWAGCGAGGLQWRLLEGDREQTRVQVETYRQTLSTVTGGVVLAPRPAEGACLVLPAGRRKAVVEMAVTPLGIGRPAKQPGAGVSRHFGSVLAMFRAEFRGFSNHSASVNVLSSQQVPAEIVPYLRSRKDASDPVALSRYSVERSLLDGGGYGYWRNLYLDCDPILVSAAGRLHMARPDVPWLRRIEPGLRAAVARMAGQIGQEGLLVCRDLSGNSGTYRWSANACDVVGFGHLDAYVNAWAYRAFRNAAGMLADLGDGDEAARCRERAARLRVGFKRWLVNPKTGWVAGWRSRDGQLHDYAFTWINGAALAFGLLDRAAARKAIAGLEALRERVGITSVRIGLPANYLPIREEDHMLGRISWFIKPTFETYTDGALMGFSLGYYLRAVSLYGSKRTARRMADEMEQGFAAGLHTGGMDTGFEFRTWEGLPSGYEGTLIYSFGSLYGIAVEQGLIQPADPEWWPGNG